MINKIKIYDAAIGIMEIIRQYEPYHIKSGGMNFRSAAPKSSNFLTVLKKHYGKTDKNSFYASYFKYINEFEDSINEISEIKFKDEPTIFICGERLELMAGEVQIRLQEKDIDFIKKTIRQGLTAFYGVLASIEIEPEYFLKKDFLWLGILTRSLSAAAAYFAFKTDSQRKIWDAFIMANPYFEDKCYRYWLDFNQQSVGVFISLLKNTKGCLTETFDVYKDNAVRDFLTNAVSGENFKMFFKNKGKRFWRPESEYSLNSFILYPKILWEFIAALIAAKIGGINGLY